LKNILHTRLALADKIQLLEKRVEDTVRGAKMAALDAVGLAKNKAVDVIESATHHLNPSVQAGRRPWILVGGAVAIGLLAGLIERRRRTSGVYSYYPPEAAGADVMPSRKRGRIKTPSGVYPFYGREQPSAGRGKPERAEGDHRPPDRIPGTWKQLSSLWDELTGELVQERDRLQQAALHAGRSLIQDVVRMAGQALIDRLSRAGSSSQVGQSRSRYE